MISLNRVCCAPGFTASSSFKLLYFHHVRALFIGHLAYQAAQNKCKLQLERCRVERSRRAFPSLLLLTYKTKQQSKKKSLDLFIGSPLVRIILKLQM